MANTFKRYTQRNIGVTPTTVGAYTVGAATQVTLIGLTVANVSASPIEVDVAHSDGTNTTYIVKDAPIPVGSALVAVGGEQKVVLEVGDSIVVTSSAATSADVIVSLLEIT